MLEAEKAKKFEKDAQNDLAEFLSASRITAEADCQRGIFEEKQMLEFKVRDLISKRDRVCRDATLALEWVKCNPHLSKAAYNKVEMMSCHTLSLLHNVYLISTSNSAQQTTEKERVRGADEEHWSRHWLTRDNSSVMQSR